MINGNPDINDANCDKNLVAAACGCSPPFGIDRATTTTIATTTTVEATTTTTVCLPAGSSCDPNAKPDPCCGDCVEETAGSGIYKCVT